MFVPFVDNAAPRGPSVDAKRGGEEVIIGCIGGDFIIISARNHTNSFVMFVLVEHFFAESKERK